MGLRRSCSQLVPDHLIFTIFWNSLMFVAGALVPLLWIGGFQMLSVESLAELSYRKADIQKHESDDSMLSASANLLIKDGPVPSSGYSLIWSDEFDSLSLRSGGPTQAGLRAGKGTWTAAYHKNENPKGHAWDG